LPVVVIPASRPLLDVSTRTVFESAGHVVLTGFIGFSPMKRSASGVDQTVKAEDGSIVYDFEREVHTALSGRLPSVAMVARFASGSADQTVKSGIPVMVSVSKHCATYRRSYRHLSPGGYATRRCGCCAVLIKSAKAGVIHTGQCVKILARTHHLVYSLLPSAPMVKFWLVVAKIAWRSYGISAQATA